MNSSANSALIEFPPAEAASRQLGAQAVARFPPKKVAFFQCDFLRFRASLPRSAKRPLAASS